MADPVFIMLSTGKSHPPIVQTRLVQRTPTTLPSTPMRPRTVPTSGPSIKQPFRVSKRTRNSTDSTDEEDRSQWSPSPSGSTVTLDSLNKGKNRCVSHLTQWLSFYSALSLGRNRSVSVVGMRNEHGCDHGGAVFECIVCYVVHHCSCGYL